MPSNQDGPKYPLLGYGERYIEPTHKVVGGPEKAPERSYEEARQRLKSQISELQLLIDEIPQELKMADCVVASLRQPPAYIAKSYYPSTLFNSGALTSLGSRRWIVDPENPESDIGKMFFVRTSEERLKILDRLLDRSESSLHDNWKNDIRRIEQLDLQTPGERILGFGADWEKGVVEIVLHPVPSEKGKQALGLLAGILEAEDLYNDDFRTYEYTNGPTFVGAHLVRETFDVLGHFNLLRVVRPMGEIQISSLRNAPSEPGPTPPPKGTRSKVIVGVFDGGAYDCPILGENVVINNDLFETPAPVVQGDDYLLHGTAVSGAVLYGPLNDYGPGDTLPQPAVSVESFRVLRSDGKPEFQLYDAMDLVGRIVSARKDIKVFNVSFGPKGPILDDDITRFTHLVDSLAHPDRALFCVAVGNDGRLVRGLNRIQSPSDAVNAIGVGAYTYDGQWNIMRAPYSCIGAGREGCKVKPDVVAFGGCSNHPIHLSAPDGKRADKGTSFAAPIVAGRAAELMGRCDKISPLVARALLIHTAKHPEDKVDDELGHGVILDSADEILDCSEKRVTVLYRSYLLPTNYAKLPIPMIVGSQVRGPITIRWTIAMTTPVDMLNADEYTEGCIEDAFHPHSDKYRFYEPPEFKRARILDVAKDSSEVRRLVSLGWKKSQFPVTVPSQVSAKKELDLRADLKWDTVVRRFRTVRPSSLKDPFLVLHGMSRNGFSSRDRLEYAAVVTLSVPKYAGNLYDDVRRVYNRLEPIRVKAVNEILVSVS